MALISDSAKPVHVFSLLLLHPCDPITDVLRAEKIVFVSSGFKISFFASRETGREGLGFFQKSGLLSTDRGLEWDYFDP